MPVRLGSFLRAVGYALELVAHLLYVAADVLEQIGLSQDVDTYLWISLVVCLYFRKFSLFFGVVVIIVVSSPVWSSQAKGGID